MDLLYFISFIALVFSSIYGLIITLKQFKKQNTSGYLFIIPVIFLFYVLPPLLDIIFNTQFQTSFYIQEAMNTVVVEIIYNFYICITLIVFSIKAKKSAKIKVFSVQQIRETSSQKLINFYDSYYFFIWLLFLIPLVFSFVFGDYNYYTTYLERPFLYSGNIPKSHSVLSKFFLLSVLIGTFIITVLALKKKKHNKIIGHLLFFSILIVGVYFWLHGKRSIVAVYISLQLALFFVSNALSIKKYFRLTLVSIILFIGFLSFYGKNISDNFESSYSALRTDFSRDYGVKFVIYNDLLLERHILPAKFESFKFILAFFIPREIFPNKPHPYAVYFTNSAFGNFGGNTIYGWGLTTSIFTESISNLGWFGLFFGPYLLILILSKERKSTNPFFKLLSIIIVILLPLLQAISFMILILFYLVLLFREPRAKKYIYNG